MSESIVIYHAGCWDGFCAAWIARKKLPHATFVPAIYRGDPPDVRGMDVYIIDFCYSAEVTATIIGQARSVVILDHHKSAHAELAKLEHMTLPVGTDVKIVFDMEKSGGRLAQEFFGVPKSWIVDYTEDRDLWRHKLPSSREINACLRSFPLDFELWDIWELAGDEACLRGFANQGTAILRVQKQVVDFLVSRAYEHEIAGYRVPVVNATCHASEIAGELCKGKPFAAVFFVQGNQRIWSLRSDENGMDVSDIARSLGGGGHARAAGFQESIKF